MAVRLAPLSRRPEYVGIFAVVIAELKFRDIEREIFAPSGAPAASVQTGDAWQDRRKFHRSFWAAQPRSANRTARDHAMAK
jgi:hypothetical protein